MEEEFEPLTTKYYGEKWKDKACREWMRNVKKDMDWRFQAANKDWEEYSCSDYDYLEGFIALDIYGFPERNNGDDNLIKRYSIAQRLAVAKIRSKMETVAGKSKKKITCNQVIVHVRFKDQINNGGSQLCTVPVYRVQYKERKEEKEKFVDWEGSVYDSWADYLENNKLEPGMMCYYDGGFERDANNNNDNNSNIFTKRKIFFTETARCGILSQVVDIADEAVSHVSVATATVAPIVSVASFFTPVGWVATAGYLAWATYGLSMASAITTAYGIARTAHNIYDKSTHQQEYLTDVLHIASSIIPIIANKGISTYMKEVAASGQSLPTVTKMVINGLLIGMTTTQVYSCFSLLSSFVTNPEISALDVIMFSISLKNITSTLMSFKLASQLLLEARADYERMKDAKGKKEEEKRENAKKKEANRENKSNENEEMIDDYKIRAEKKVTDKIEVKNEKKTKGEKSDDKKESNKEEDSNGNNEMKKIEKNEDDILEKMRQELTKYRKIISTDEGRVAFDQFVEKETADRVGNELVDQNKRIIHVMREMDPNAVFNAFGATNSEIHFSNGETTELMINNNIRLHPRAMAQLMTDDRTYTEITENNNEHRVTALHKYCEATAILDKELDACKEDVEKMDLARKKFMNDIKTFIKTDSFFTESHILDLQQKIREFKLDPQDQSIFDNLTPPQAFRMNTVMNDLLRIKVLTEKGVEMNRAKDVLLTALELNKQCGGAPNDVFRLAEMVELVKLVVAGYDSDGKRSSSDKNKSIMRETAHTLSEKGEMFKALVESTKEDMERCGKIARNSEMPFGSDVAFAYHIRKHGNDEYSYFEADKEKKPFFELTAEERGAFYPDYLTKDLRKKIILEETDATVFTNPNAPEGITHNWTKLTPVFSQDGNDHRTTYSLILPKLGTMTKERILKCFTSQRVDSDGNYVSPRTIRSVFSSY